MSDEQTTDAEVVIDETTDQTTETTDEVINTDTESEVVTESEETTDEATEDAETEKPNDLVAAALAEQEKLKAELEALKNADGDIFEKNAILKSELEDAKKLADMAAENAKLQDQLEGIKREAITKRLIASGSLTGKMKEWADGLSFDQLQAFAEMAPKRKNILQQTNGSDEVTEPVLEMQKWAKEQQKSRIIS